MLTGGGSSIGLNWWNRVQFRNYWEIAGVVEQTLDGVSSSLLRGGPEMRTAGRFVARYHLTSDPRPRVSWLMDLGWSPANEEGSRSTFVGPGAVIRPTARAELQ